VVPRLISAKKAFHASTDDAGAAEKYANQLSISLFAFILFGQRPTTWHGISRCKGNALDMPNRFQFIHFLQAWLAVMAFHALLRLPIRSFTMQGIQNVAFEQSRQTRRDLQRYFAV
jgi:hypothetical protein